MRFVPLTAGIADQEARNERSPQPPEHEAPFLTRIEDRKEQRFTQLPRSVLIDVIDLKVIVEDVVEECRAGDEYSTECELCGAPRGNQQFGPAPSGERIEQHPCERRGESDCQSDI